MTKKIYNISGFDCPVCAAKTEAYLSKQDNVSNIRLDFSGNKLYITYKNEPWTLEQLSEVIKQVEDDPLNISEQSSGTSKETKIFTPKMWLLIGRLIFAVAVTLVCMFALVGDDFAWLRFGLYCVAIIAIGYDIFWKVILHFVHRTSILDHNLLITIASLGSVALSILALTGVTEEEEHLVSWIAFDETFEAVMVIALFQIGSIVEQVATNKSKSAVMSAMQLRVDKANLLKDGVITVVKPEDLKFGDLIIVKTGEMIPVDGVIVDGNGLIDTSSLTGEYVPVQAELNKDAFSGCLLKSGTITIKVKKIYADSTISKILKLIESGGEKKSKADKFIAKFSKYYTPCVVVLAILTAAVGLIVTRDWATWIHTGLEILVIGCPCAIVISVPLAYFSGIGLASKKGIVIKGANYLDELSKLGTLITDKTGTITHGSFTVQNISTKGMNKDEFMNYLYAVECLSTHPIGKAVCHNVNTKKISAEVKNFLEIAGLGTSCDYNGHHIIAGNEKMMVQNNIQFEECNENGSIVYVSVDNAYIGYVVLADTIKDDAQPMVNLLHNEGVEIVLLTGDHEENAKDICNKLGIDRWHSELLPEDKTKYLELEMKDNKKSVAFIGDGINDAPSIIRSDIGIAMGGIGSDIAVENADIVIMNDDPAKVYDAMKIAKMSRHTSIFNIVFALVVKAAVFIAALLISVFNINDHGIMMYVAVFADTGLTVILVINSLLLLYRKVKRK